jgi:hypothetical protein
MEMHPILIAQLADQRRSDLLREASDARLAAGVDRPRLRDRWVAALTRLTARAYRPSGVPVCCPA